VPQTENCAEDSELYRAVASFFTTGAVIPPYQPDDALCPLRTLSQQLQLLFRTDRLVDGHHDRSDDDHPVSQSQGKPNSF
jgi:hypothetical protein